MRFAKRILSACFSVMILFTSVHFAYAEEGTTSDTVYGEYGYKIETLNALNITSIQLDSFLADAPVTREMFSKGVSAMILDDVGSVSMEPLGDLSADDKGMLYLNSIGIVKGMGDNVFKPYDNITVEQAAKISVSLLGFGEVSEYNGGYSSGYMAEAIRIGLLNGCSLSGSQELNMGSYVNMLYNLLDIDILEHRSYGTLNTYHRADGNTLISEYRNIVKGTGIVTKNMYSDLYAANSSTRDGVVAINGVYYDVGETNAEEFLGLHTKFYFWESEYNDEKKILYINASSKNDSILVNSDDIISYNSGVYTFYTNGNSGKKEVKIPSSAVIIYNGVFYPVLDAKKYVPSYGSVEFISNDGDSTYDVIKIKDITVTIVLSVTSDGLDIYDKYDKDYNIHLEEDRYSLTLANGKKGTGLNVKKDDVVEVVKSVCSDGVYYNLKVISDSVTDTVQKIQTGNLVMVNEETKEEKTVTVPDELCLTDNTYCVSKRLKELVASGKVSTPAVGSTYVFLLNSRGEITDISDTQDKPFRIGYFKRYSDGKNSLDKKSMIRLFDESGTWETYELAQKIKLNGDPTKSKDITSLDAYIGTVCKYKLNIAGEVTSLDFPSETNEDFKKVYSMKDPYFRRYYGSPVFGPKSDDDGVTCSIKSTSVIFVIPNFADASVDENSYGYQYAVIPSSKLPNYISYSNVDIYNTDGEFGIGDVAVVKMKTHGYVLNENSTRPVLVNKCVQVLDDDVIKTEVTALANGNKIKFFVEDLRTGGGVLPFGPGDLIFCFLAKDRTLRLYDDAKYYHILFDYDDNNPVFAKSFDWNAGSTIGVSYRSSMAGDVRIRYGSVYKADSEYLWLNTSANPSDTSSVEATKYSSARIYVYDKEDKEYSLGSAADIVGYTSDTVNYSKAVVVYSDSYTEIVIY